MFKVPEKARLVQGSLASDESYGNNGAFLLQIDLFTVALCIASDGDGWEHVSVTIYKKKNLEPVKRCPFWHEMNAVKDVFWTFDETVMQLHPPKAEYVNNHPYCLHLWKPVGVEIQRPNPILVGLLKFKTHEEV